MEHVDVIAALIAAFTYMLINGFWYSPLLFKDLWLELKGIKKEGLRNKWLSLFFNSIIAFILAFFLSLIEVYVGANSFLDGIVTGAIIYFGFIFPIQITNVIWVKKSFKLFFLENSCTLLSLMTMGGVVAG
jgi:hypothetical protein